MNIEIAASTAKLAVLKSAKEKGVSHDNMDAYLEELKERYGASANGFFLLRAYISLALRTCFCLCTVLSVLLCSPSQLEAFVVGHALRPVFAKPTRDRPAL